MNKHSNCMDVKRAGFKSIPFFDEYGGGGFISCFFRGIAGKDVFFLTDLMT